MTIRDEKLNPFFIKVTEHTFDLMKPQKVEKGKHKGSMVEVNYGYFSCLEFAVEKVIRLNMSEKSVSLSLKEYLDEYKTEKLALESVVIAYEGGS